MTLLELTSVLTSTPCLLVLTAQLALHAHAGTLRRPVPLEHQLYYGGELFSVCTKELFLTDGVRQVGCAQADGGGAAWQGTAMHTA